MNPAFEGKYLYAIFTEKDRGLKPVEDLFYWELELELDPTDGWFYSEWSNYISDDSETRFGIDPFMEKGFSFNRVTSQFDGCQPEYDIEILRHPKDTPELRAYFFQNFYLQGIHAGIQTAHTIAEMGYEYLPALGCGVYGGGCGIFADWAKDHKTVIVLNGGMQSDLEKIYEHLSKQDFYPYGKFHEEQAALNGALTNVGIVLPDTVFNYKQFVKQKEEDGIGYVPKLTEWELEMAEILSKCKLMN